MIKHYLAYFGIFLIGAAVSSLVSFLLSALLLLIFRNEIACFVVSTIVGIVPAYFCGIMGLPSQGKNSYFVKNKVKPVRAMALLLPCFCLCFVSAAVMLSFVIMGFDQIYSSSKASSVIDVFGSLLSFTFFCGLISMIGVITSKCSKCGCTLCIDKIGETDHQQNDTTESKTKNYSGTSKVGSAYSGGTKVGDVYQDWSSSQTYTRRVTEKSHNDIMKCLHCGNMKKRRVKTREYGKWH